MKVNQQAHVQSGAPQIRQKLGVEDRIETVHAFQFDNHSVFDNEIGSKVSQRLSLVDDREGCAPADQQLLERRDVVAPVAGCSETAGSAPQNGPETNNPAGNFRQVQWGGISYTVHGSTALGQA